MANGLPPQPFHDEDYQWKCGRCQGLVVRTQRPPLPNPPNAALQVPSAAQSGKRRASDANGRGGKSQGSKKPKSNKVRLHLPFLSLFLFSPSPGPLSFPPFSFSSPSLSSLFYRTEADSLLPPSLRLPAQRSNPSPLRTRRSPTATALTLSTTPPPTLPLLPTPTRTLPHLPFNHSLNRKPPRRILKLR